MIDAFETPGTVTERIAKRARERRLAMRLTQAELASKAGLPIATYRRFEQKGQISLTGLVQIAFAMDCMSDFNALFASTTWATMDDMLQQSKPSKRIRHD